MGWRFRRSTSFGPFRFTFSKRGTGVSVGGPGARVGIGADGRVRETFGIPGTGLSYQRTFTSHAIASRKIAKSLPYHPGRPPSAQPLSLGIGCGATIALYALVAAIVPAQLKGMALFALVVLPLVLRLVSSVWARRKNEERFAIYLQRLVDRFGEDNVRHMVGHDPWQGATQEMIRVMYGEPDDVSTRVHKQTTAEVWKYAPIAKNRYQLRVEFENGVCVGWQTA